MMKKVMVAVRIRQVQMNQSRNLNQSKSMKEDEMKATKNR
jgi:hypothetical protein